MMQPVPKIQDRLFSADYIPPPDVQIISIREKMIATTCNYIVYSGLPKTGKSTFISGLIASAFLPCEVFGQKIHLPENRKKIALIDTEMSPYDLHRARERISKLADRPIDRIAERLDIFSMREDPPPVIREFIENYLKETPEACVVIIDGFLDLCMNYNDEVETRAVTNWLKRLTKIYDCCIVGVLHLSKNAGETVGHLGSNTDRWAQSTMTIKRVKETRQLVLEPKFLRSSDDFDPVAIYWDDDFKKWREADYIKPPDPVKRGPGRPKKN
jgi:RecA-family ATPase